MFGIGFFELVVIAIVALIFVGPKKLPDFMKSAGRLFVQVRRTASDVRATFDQVVRDAEDELRREDAREFQKALLASTANNSGASSEDANKSDALDALHHEDGTLKNEAESSFVSTTPEGVKPYQPQVSNLSDTESKQEEKPTTESR